MRKQAITTNFWRANLNGEIRIGYYVTNGVFHTLNTVPVRGREYTDAEARRAEALAAKLNKAAA